MPIQIDHILLDRARTIRRTKGSRVRHETQIVDELGPWFPCRIAPATGDEIYRAAKREINLTHQFIARMLDFEGQEVFIEDSDKIEVETGTGIGSDYTNNSQNAGIYEIASVAFKPRNGQEGEELLWVTDLRRLKEF